MLTKITLNILQLRDHVSVTKFPRKSSLQALAKTGCGMVTKARRDRGEDQCYSGVLHAEYQPVNVPTCRTGE